LRIFFSIKICICSDIRSWSFGALAGICDIVVTFKCKTSTFGHGQALELVVLIEKAVHAGRAYLSKARKVAGAERARYKRKGMQSFAKARNLSSSTLLWPRTAEDIEAMRRALQAVFETDATISPLAGQMDRSP
jgi:hypothetical protein